MQRTNNLINKLIREDKFPAILFANYNRDMTHLLRTAQICTYKFNNVANQELEDEADKFWENMQQWEKEYQKILSSSSNQEQLRDLGIKDDGRDIAQEAVKKLKEDDGEFIDKEIEEMLGKDLIGQIKDKLDSSARAKALEGILKEISEKDNIDKDHIN